MKAIPTKLEGVVLLEPQVFGDHRGYFMESYHEGKLKELGIPDRFVQDNESFTKAKGTVRGLHFQNAPMAQSKLVRVQRGAVMDVAVDLRKGSPTYLEWIGVELSEQNKRMLYIPRGFAHGFVTRTDDVIFQYKVDHFYSPSDDRSIRYDEPAIGVDWGTADPILSEKDRNAPSLKDSDCNFMYGG